MSKKNATTNRERDISCAQLRDKFESIIAGIKPREILIVKSGNCDKCNLRSNMCSIASIKYS